MQGRLAVDIQARISGYESVLTVLTSALYKSSVLFRQSAFRSGATCAQEA